MIQGNIFSVVYKDYKEERQNRGNIDNNNNENEKRRNNIDNLNIENNDDDFNQVIMTKFEDVKNKTIKQFENYMEKYKTSFTGFKKNISKYLEDSKNRIGHIFENENKNETLYKFISKNIFKKLNNLMEIYDNIINNIEDNFNLLNKYLIDNDIINSKKPLEQFLKYYNENIINSSIMSKFKFDEINPFNIVKDKYYRNYFNYLLEVKKNIPIKILIMDKDNNMVKNDIKALKEYFSYNNLKIVNINTNELQNLLEAISNNKNNQNNLVKLNIKNFDFTLGFNENRLINDKLSKIQKLKFLHGKYLNNILLSKTFLNKGESLINLSLEKINMTDMGRKKLFNYLYTNENILENIKYLSLSGNKITSIIEGRRNEEGEDPNKNKIFKNLQIFDLSKNQIYKYEIPSTKLPELKLLDLTGNSIPTGASMEAKIKEGKKVLYLYNDNIFITNNSENNKIYIDYINKTFPNCSYDLKKLNLRFTYDIENQNNLKNLKFSPTTRISLIKLDLSFCGLTTDIMINFLKNNFGLFSLKNLKLKYNNIKSDFFEKILIDQLFLNNLETLDLSYNEIPCKKVEEHTSLIKFIENNSNLSRIKLKNSSYYNNWILLTSPDYDNTKQYTKLYIDLVIYLKKNYRKFIFVVDNSSNVHLDEKYREIFTFISD